MFKLPFAVINNQDFVTSIKKMASEACFKEVKTLYSFKRISQNIEKMLREGAEIYNSLVIKHAVKDEAGKTKLDENQHPLFVNKEEFEAELTAFLVTNKEIKWPLLKVSDFEKLPLTLAELSVLSPIFEKDVD